MCHKIFSRSVLLALFCLSITARADSSITSWSRGKGWEAKHETILQKAGVKLSQDAPDSKAVFDFEVMLLGDSITRGWLSTQQWKNWSGRLSIVNAGIGGDRTPNVLWRVEHGLLDKIKAKKIFLMIGTNDLLSTSPQETIDGVAAIVKAIQTKSPHSEIFLMRIPPMGKRSFSPVRKKVLTYNNMLEYFGKYMKIPVVGAPEEFFLDKAGEIDKTLIFDGVHMTKQGYALYGKNLAPHIF